MQAPGVTVQTAAAHRDYIATLAENPAESLVLVARLQPAGEQLAAQSTVLNMHLDSCNTVFQIGFARSVAMHEWQRHGRDACGCIQHMLETHERLLHLQRMVHRSWATARQPVSLGWRCCRLCR